jgi:hypothetical protein
MDIIIESPYTSDAMREKIAKMQNIYDAFIEEDKQKWGDQIKTPEFITEFNNLLDAINNFYVVYTKQNFDNLDFNVIVVEPDIPDANFIDVTTYFARAIDIVAHNSYFGHSKFTENRKCKLTPHICKSKNRKCNECSSILDCIKLFGKISYASDICRQTLDLPIYPCHTTLLKFEGSDSYTAC